MMRTIAFRLAVPTILLNEWQRMHYHARARYSRALAWQVAAALTERPAQPFEQAHLVIRRHSVRAPDVDGIYGGAKPLIDALLVPSKTHPHGLGLIVDDSADRLTLEVHHVQALSRATQCTVVEIREAT